MAARAPGALIEMAGFSPNIRRWRRRTVPVFFDGEEAYENFTDTDGLYGSRYFAADCAKKNEIRWRHVAGHDYAIAPSTITLPPDSPPQLATRIFAAAEA